MTNRTLTIVDNRTNLTYTLPVENGTIRAVDLRKIKTAPDDFGLMSYDPAFLNTASCQSKITLVDGERSILRYRGYDIQELAENCTHPEALSQCGFLLRDHFYEAMGFRQEMFTVLFAIPRTTGWLAQWQEMMQDPEQKIARPRPSIHWSRSASIGPEQEGSLEAVSCPDSESREVLGSVRPFDPTLMWRYEITSRVNVMKYERSQLARSSRSPEISRMTRRSRRIVALK